MPHLSPLGRAKIIAAIKARWARSKKNPARSKSPSPSPVPTMKKSKSPSPKAPKAKRTATPTATATPGSPATITYVDRSKLELSPFNHRKLTGLDEDSLTQLADSIRQQGVITPLTVRPLNGSGTYEIISGERRYRASETAGLAQLPCIIRDATDAEARELQLIENLQREGISPMEEAQGLQDLLDQRDADGNPTHTLETLALRLGRGTRTVRNRLKLLILPAEIQDAIIAGKCSESIANLIVTIPDPEKQARFAREVLSPFSIVKDGLSKINDENQEPKSVREAKAHLAFHYQKRLKGCRFSQTDPDLVPIETAPDGERIAGGACEDCPWRSGNIEGSASADVCTNVACFQRKEAADVAKAKATLKEEGVTLLTGNKAPQVVREEGEVKVSSNEYVSLTDTVPGKKTKTWKDVIEAAPENTAAPQQFAVKDGKQIVHLVKVTDALAAAKAAGVEVKQPAPPAPEKDWAAERKAKQEKAERLHRIAAAALPDILAAVQAGDPATWLAHALAESNVSRPTQERRGWAKLNDKDYAVAIRGLTLNELVGLIFEEALCSQPVSWEGDWNTRFTTAAQLAGVDLKAIGKKLGKPTAEQTEMLK